MEQMPSIKTTTLGRNQIKISNWKLIVAARIGIKNTEVKNSRGFDLNQDGRN